jgi:hypothetical protein
MTIMLNVPMELETRLEEEAARREQPVEDYALSLIERNLPPPDQMPELKTGADVVAYWKANGLIGDWADREDIGDSVESARELRRQAETRSHD